METVLRTKPRPQDHRIIQGQSDLRRFSPTSCSQANQPWDLFHSIRLTWYKLPRHPVPVLDCPRGEKGSPYIKSKPRVSICVFCFSKFIFSMNLRVGTGRLLLCTPETFSSPCWANLVRFSSWDFHPSVSVKSKQGTETVTASKQPPKLSGLKTNMWSSKKLQSSHKTGLLNSDFSKESSLFCKYLLRTTHLMFQHHQYYSRAEKVSYNLRMNGLALVTVSN